MTTKEARKRLHRFVELERQHSASVRGPSRAVPSEAAAALVDDVAAVLADRSVNHDLALAAFRAGWAAACVSIAEMFAERADLSYQVPFFRALANEPPPVEIAGLSTPEGQDMRRNSETVLYERIQRSGGADGKEGP